MSAPSIKTHVPNPRLKNVSKFRGSVKFYNHTKRLSAKKPQILRNTENVPVHNRFQVLTACSADDNDLIQTSTSACDSNLCDTGTVHFVGADKRSFQYSRECKHPSLVGVQQPLLAEQVNYNFLGNKNETGLSQRGYNYTKTCSAGADFTKGLSPVSGSNLRLLSQIIGTFYLSPWAQP